MVVVASVAMCVSACSGDGRTEADWYGETNAKLKLAGKDVLSHMDASGEMPTQWVMSRSTMKMLDGSAPSSFEKTDHTQYHYVRISANTCAIVVVPGFRGKDDTSMAFIDATAKHLIEIRNVNYEDFKRQYGIPVSAVEQMTAR